MRYAFSHHSTSSFNISWQAAKLNRGPVPAPLTLPLPSPLPVRPRPPHCFLVFSLPQALDEVDFIFISVMGPGLSEPLYTGRSYSMMGMKMSTMLLTRNIPPDMAHSQNPSPRSSDTPRNTPTPIIANRPEVIKSTITMKPPVDSCCCSKKLSIVSSILLAVYMV